MDQFASILSHLSLQNIVEIATIIGAIGPLLTQGNGVKNDTRVIIRYVSNDFDVTSEQLNNSGCVFRAFLYIAIMVCSVGLVISLLHAPFAQALFPPPSSTQQAQTLVQTFFDDINNKDYQSAYYLTKDGFSRSYDEFADGYSLTEYNEISFEKVEKLADNTVRVVIVIKATEKLLIGTGSVTSYYRSTYITGLDHGRYVILRGTAVKISKP
ncbi:hypothetical protein KSF_054720 [Reticulibacter mediterranei]|uniref:Uncharacterized protein n=1 Tax=Reticulibacter mediterranei TaxID=2778369 RepID=A0A8J3N1S0_9CHLR|nr:hypothetical protein [Reticulibacter mediterranei]GHO95424.1 hypothetical protein KSF_054720 [Reticulibacter mediterranei]